MCQCRRSDWCCFAAGPCIFCNCQEKMGSSHVALYSFLPLFVTVTLGLRHWFWALSCPLPRELDHNDISGTIEDTNGAFTGLENLSKLWVSLALNSASQFCCVPVWGWVCSFLFSLPHLGTRQNQQQIWAVVVLQAHCKSANGVFKHWCF